MSNATKVNGIVLYEGPSRIDGKPIVVVLTGLAKGSKNAKTGDMLQTWILRADVSPADALRTGADVSICGACPHRPKVANGTTWGERSCYVNVVQGPRMVWEAYKRGRYVRMSSADAAALVAGRWLRLGSYGDPAAVAADVWAPLVAAAAGHTGYTHQWKAPRLRDALAFCQASADTAADVAKIGALGVGYFRVAPAGALPEPGEVLCPASEEAGRKVTCADCRMCDGSGRKVMIPAHGIGKAYVAKRAALPVMA